MKMDQNSKGLVSARTKDETRESAQAVFSLVSVHARSKIKPRISVGKGGNGVTMACMV